MHLKSYPKLVRSELRLDASGVEMSSQRSSLFVSQQGGLLRTCSSDHGNNNNSSRSRHPLSIISTNTLCCSNTPNSSCSSVATLRLRAPSTTALQLLLPLPDRENHMPKLFQTAAEDTDTPLDIWTVIKPGHVREKIAIFASEGAHVNSARGGASPVGTDRAPMTCTNNPAVTGPLRAAKAKGSWEENSSAKRRRRSGNNQDLQLNPDTQDATQHTIKQSPRQIEEEEEQQKVSVVEMVAFLEQRASEHQPDSKPLLALQRSATTLMLSRAPPPDAKGEGPESFRVSDMVAKLESECLRRSTEGGLSRNNSLRRRVGRVLLAAAAVATGDQSSIPCQLLSPLSSSSSPPAAQNPNGKPISSPESIRTEPPSVALAPPPSGEAGGLQTLNTPLTQTPQSEEAEPLPGLLFLPLPPLTDPHPARHRTTSEREPIPARPRPSLVRLFPCDSGCQSEKRPSESQERREEDAGFNQCSVAAPLSRRLLASQDFLELRQRVQQLLEPQPYLSALPHHLLLHILRLLPTQSLAALKCTCSYFKFVIETYGVRPADSLWVSDPRYRDDPCKQCKKRYGHGDVSLCRWHHKPYCQALPDGPGYWMCCYSAHRDTPGCNVGLHDNRWVPAFHSINVPIYRRIGNHDD